MTARKYTYPGWTLSAWSLDGLQWSCQCDTNAIHEREEASCPVCMVPRPPDCEHPPSQGERMTRPTKYDDDGVRAKAEKRPDERLGNFLATAGAVAVFAVVCALAVATHTLRVRIDTLEYRIDYDRAREVEWFNRVNTQLFELAVEAIETRQTLARAIKAHHPGGTTAKAYMTDTEFYGKVTFYGPVEFIPEEE